MITSKVRRALALQLAVVLPICGALSVASTLPVQASTVPGWHVKTVLNPGAGNQGILLDVTADAPGDAWAVGMTGPVSGTSTVPMIVRWNGTAWSQVTLPAPVQTALGTDFANTITAGSPRNVWAFGLLSTWVHFNGATWTSGQLVPPGPGGTALVQSALALSTSNVWAFGAKSKSTGQHAYAAHFNGVKWTGTSVPGTAAISDASAVSAGDVWAVESGGPSVGPTAGRSALVHWSGGAWHSVGLPAALASRPLTQVVANSDKNVWVGSWLRNSKKGATEAVGHWNGRAWTVQTMPVTATSQMFAVSALASDGHGGIWAIGNCTSCSGYLPSRIWHESAGTWKRAVMASKYPYLILRMALAPGTTSVWGVGAVAVGKTTNALVALDGSAPH